MLVLAVLTNMQREYCIPVTVMRSLQALSARPVYRQINGNVTGLSFCSSRR